MGPLYRFILVVKTVPSKMLLVSSIIHWIPQDQEQMAAKSKVTPTRLSSIPREIFYLWPTVAQIASISTALLAPTT